MTTTQTALVTGASSGIGEAVVRKLTASGWEVHALARRAARLQALANQTGCTPHALDIRDGEALERLTAGLAPDLLVNNAGLGAGITGLIGATRDEVEAGRLAGLFEEIVGAESERAHGVGNRSEAGQEDPLTAVSVVAHRLQKIQCIAVGQAHVGKNDERLASLFEQQSARIRQVDCAFYLPAAALEMTHQLVSEQFLVFDDQ